MSQLTVDQALPKAIAAHKAGQVREADRLYTAILKAQPKHPDANHNMGVLAVGVGKVEQALPFFKTALEANPNTEQFWLSYIDALIRIDKLREAQIILDQAKIKGASGDSFKALDGRLARSTSKAQFPRQDQLQELMELYKQGKVQQALNKTACLIQQFPASHELYNFKGAMLVNLKQFGQSIDFFDRALTIKPDYTEAYNNLGVALQEQGKLENAIEAYNKVLAIKPDNADAHYNKGNTLKELGKLNEAIQSYHKVLIIKPDYADAYFNMGNAFKELGKLNEAIQSYHKVLIIKPDYTDAYFNMGNAFKEQDKLEEAIESYKKVLTIKPDYAEAYDNMGVTLKEQGKLSEAVLSYQKAISLKPHYAKAYNDIGNALKAQGKLDEAVEAYKTALVHKPNYAEAHRHLSLITNYTIYNDQISEVKALLERPFLSDTDRCNLLYAQAKMQEDICDLSAAFDSYVAGGELRRRLLEYDFKQDERMFGLIEKTAPEFQNLTINVIDKSVSPTPIFILGMPRSGTTLVEQIVSSHSEITGAGELGYVARFGGHIATGIQEPTLTAVSLFRRRYLDELNKKGNGKAFITDKMPQNFRYLPLICSAFPEAKIIHVQRSANAVCWSNFKHYFFSNSLGYSYRLEDTVSYYKLYRNLMKLWNQNYGARIYNLNYENLTHNQVPETRRLIEYLGVNWDDACLRPENNKRTVNTASQRQVRHKIYKGSSQQWRKYEQFLNDIFDRIYE